MSWIHLVNRKREHSLEFVVAERVAHLATLLQIRKPPRVIVADVPLGPAVTGLFRPRIVLPRQLVQQLSEAALRQGDYYLAHVEMESYPTTPLGETWHRAIPLKPITIHVHDVSLRSLVDHVCEELECEWRADGDTIRLSVDEWPKLATAIANKANGDAGSNNESPTARLSYQLLQPINVTIEADTAFDALSKISSQCGFNLVLDGPAIDSMETTDGDSVSFDVTQIPLRSLLALVCARFDLDWTQEVDVIHVQHKGNRQARAYSVSDLVVPLQKQFSALTQQHRQDSAAGHFATGPVSKHGDHQHASHVVDENEVDFTPLIELIKTNVAPDSWEADTSIVASHESLSLVIWHYPRIHAEVRDLLQELRGTIPHKAAVKCEVLRFETDEQQVWLKEQVTFHAGEQTPPWHLLPAGEGDAFVPRCIDTGTSRRLSRVQAVIRPGQDSEIEVCTGPDSMRLNLRVDRVASGQLLILSVGIAPSEVDPMSRQTEREYGSRMAMGNGQTLLLDVTDIIQLKGRDSDGQPDVPRTIVALTPESLPRDRR